jgi:hypothetical protein
MGSTSSSDTLGFQREIKILRYAIMGWLEADPVPDHLTTFTCYKESGWRHFLIGILFILGFESIAVQILLYGKYLWIADLHALFAVYSLLWLLGDYQAIKKNLTVLTCSTLSVRVGLRWNFSIPVKDIAHVDLGEPAELTLPVEIKMGSFVSERKLPEYGVILVFGKPTVHLTLRKPLTTRSGLGRSKTLKQIGLGIDEPLAFVQVLREYLKIEG